MSFRHLWLLFLLLLFLHALAFIFRSLVRLTSLSSLFSIWARVAVFAWAVFRGGLAALCLVSQLSVRSRGALLRRLDLRRCACDSKLFPKMQTMPKGYRRAGPRPGTPCPSAGQCQPTAGHSVPQCRPVPAYGRALRAQCRPCFRVSNAPSHRVHVQASAALPLPA